MVRPFAAVLLTLLAAVRVGQADGSAPATAPVTADDPDAPEPAKTEDEARSGPSRRPDMTLRQVMRGPFRTSRLFSMPTADVVGAYVLSISGDGSLLQETGLLTSAGVVAVGFGDIAQLEYRHSAAISISGVNAPLPGVGVQIKLPIPEHDGVPALGASFRLGVPRREVFDGTNVDEKVSDLYLVGRLHIDALDALTLHGGVRISSAQVTLTGTTSGSAKETVYLPTGGWDIKMSPQSHIVGEAALVPQFRWMPGTDEPPTIGYGLLGRLGMRWAVIPSVIIDGSIGYQLEVANAALASGPSDVVHWDIRLGAEVFVPWGALACRASGVFCD